MIEETNTVTINIHIPKDQRLLLRAIRRALGFFKALLKEEAPDLPHD